MKEISFNVAEAIPYKNFKEKINIVMEELLKDRYVEIIDGFVYSVDKWREDNDNR